MLRLLHDIDDHARHNGSAIAVRSVGRERRVEISRRQLLDQIFAIGQVVRDRVAHRRPVVLNYPNRPEFIAAFLGVLSADGVLFPVAADASGPELSGAIRRSGAGAVIAGKGGIDEIARLFDHVDAFPQLSESAVLLSGPRFESEVTRASGPALLLQSSGTTGEPKIVRRDGASLDAVTQNMIRACGFTETDHVLAAVPLCHSYGLEHGILAPIAAGSCVHVCEKFDLPAVLQELHEGSITILPGVPFMFDMLCQTGETRFPNLRRAYSAGGPLPLSVADQFHRQFHLRIGQVYGSTEVGSITFNNPDSPNFDPQSVGMPMASVSIRVLDPDDAASVLSDSLKEGLIAVAAPSMLSGYLDDEPVPLSEKHFLTGDLGHLNPSGTLTITGRVKLLIDIGGRKVNPLEVEAVLSEHPGVGACVVIPMRLSETVQRLKAVVTRARPNAPLSIQELRKFVQDRLSRYKVPRTFEIRDSLPTSPAGKVIRHLVEDSTEENG